MANRIIIPSHNLDLTAVDIQGNSDWTGAARYTLTVHTQNDLAIEALCYQSATLQLGNQRIVLILQRITFLQKDNKSAQKTYHVILCDVGSLSVDIEGIQRVPVIPPISAPLLSLHCNEKLEESLDNNTAFAYQIHNDFFTSIQTVTITSRQVSIKAGSTITLIRQGMPAENYVVLQKKLLKATQNEDPLAQFTLWPLSQSLDSLNPPPIPCYLRSDIGEILPIPDETGNYPVALNTSLQTISLPWLQVFADDEGGIHFPLQEALPAIVAHTDNITAFILAALPSNIMQSSLNDVQDSHPFQSYAGQLFNWQNQGLQLQSGAHTFLMQDNEEGKNIRWKTDTQNFSAPMSIESATVKSHSNSGDNQKGFIQGNYHRHSQQEKKHTTTYQENCDKAWAEEIDNQAVQLSGHLIKAVTKDYDMTLQKNAALSTSKDFYLHTAQAAILSSQKIELSVGNNQLLADDNNLIFNLQTIAYHCQETDISADMVLDKSSGGVAPAKQNTSQTTSHQATQNNTVRPSPTATSGSSNTDKNSEATQTTEIPADNYLRKAMQLENAPDSWYDDLHWIMMHESSGQVGVKNPKSSARGLFQLNKSNYYLNPHGEASFGNGLEEAQGGIRYVISRYKTPSKAKAFWEQHKWY
jgi:hypothetical protein